jgi:hypothetical protein
MTDSKIRSLDFLGIKPVADSFNRITRAAVDSASAFLGRICLPAAEELGLLFRDKVANWRARNAVAIVEAARERLESGPEIAAPIQAHPRIVGQIIDAGSWADSDNVQKLWAGLLASSCTTDGKDESNLIFANLLSQLTGLEANILAYGCQTAEKGVSSAGWLFANELRVNVAELIRITGVDDLQRLDRELDHLRALELIVGGFDPDTLDADIQPTSLGLHLYARCNGHREDPSLFYGLHIAVNEGPTAEGIELNAAKPKGKSSRKKRTTRKKSG